MTFMKFVVVLAVVGFLGFGYYKYQDALAGKALAELMIAEQRQLNDSTAARLASTVAAKDSLGAAFESAKELHGKVIAALRLRVPARDTVILHDLVTDSVSMDSTRYASFKDSTFAGTVEGTVTAPPCCANLTLDYKITRPEFNPTIAFVQVKDSIAATVTWAGEQVEIIAPYAHLPRAQKRFGYWGEVRYDPVGKKGWEVQAGVQLKLPWNTSVVSGVSTDKTAFVGARKEFF